MSKHRAVQNRRRRKNNDDQYRGRHQALTDAEIWFLAPLGIVLCIAGYFGVYYFAVLCTQIADAAAK